jgi:hypothetical protein
MGATMFDRQDFRDAWSAIWPFVPPAIGAYFGMRWSVEQTKRERVTTWFCSAFRALYLGQAIGEHWELGTKSTSGVTIIVAMLLSDAMGIVVATARQWIKDPVGTFRRWRDAWLGRGDGGTP